MFVSLNSAKSKAVKQWQKKHLLDSNHSYHNYVSQMFVSLNSAKSKAVKQWQKKTSP